MQPRFKERRFVSPLLIKETSGRMGRRTYSLFSPRMNKVVDPVYRRILSLVDAHGNLNWLANMREVVNIGKSKVVIDAGRSRAHDYVGQSNKGILRVSLQGKNCFVKIDSLYSANEIAKGYRGVNEVLARVGNKVDGFTVRTPQLLLLRDSPNKEFTVCATEFFRKGDVELVTDLTGPEKTNVVRAIEKIKPLVYGAHSNIDEISAQKAFFQKSTNSIILFDIQELPYQIGQVAAVLPEERAAFLQTGPKPISMPSRLRKNIVLSVPKRMEREIETRANNAHDLSFTKLFDANQMLNHAAQVDFSKIPRRPKDYARRDPAVFIETEIRQLGSGDYHVRLLAIGKRGSSVLYKAWGNSGTTETHVGVRSPEKTNTFFVINPQRKTISLYSGGVDEPSMRTLFDESSPENLHAEFWKTFNKGSKTPAQNVMVSADYDPSSGVPVHMRSQTLRNVKASAHIDPGVFLIEKESALSAQGVTLIDNASGLRRINLNERMKPELVSRELKLRRISNINPSLKFN